MIFTPNVTHAKTILIATQNKHKRREILDIVRDVPGVSFLGVEDFPFQPVVEEDGASFRDNAILKATALARACNTWAMADDSGLEVDALDGRPGVYSSRYSGPGATDKKNIQRVLAELKDVPRERRTARFVCAIALAAPRQVFFVVEGRCEGVVTRRSRGTGGFGYDPIFYLPEYKQTFAELSGSDASIKNTISHRAQALQQFKERIQPLIHGL